MHEEAVQERDRLRAARAFFARQLGPLPAFAGISVAAVGALSDEVERPWALIAALFVVAVMIVVSITYSRMPPYRQLRAKREQKWRTNPKCNYGGLARPPEATGGALGNEIPSLRQWYIAQIELERDIYGYWPSDGKKKSRLPWPDPSSNLQDLLDRERFGVFLSQGLFLAAIAFLLCAHVSV